MISIDSLTDPVLAGSDILLRQLVGTVLRSYRIDQGRTIREVAAQASVSVGYLSEIERGQKEASSELLASICEALSITLFDVITQVGALLAVSSKPHLTGITYGVEAAI